MNYVIVNYGLNQIYSVHKQAFIQIIENVFSKISNAKLADNINIQINNKQTNVDIEISYFIKNNGNLKDITNKILTSLNEGVKYLIGVEVENITLNYKGRI